MLLVLDLRQSCIKDLVPWHSSVGRLQPVMSSSLLMNELIGLVQAVHHWRPYLWGRRFTVRTYHFSLKFMFNQRLSIVPQH
jgi:hypothetical protein